MFDQILRRRPTAAPVPDVRLTIRHAYPDDAASIARLAVLDSKPAPTGEVLLAEVDGDLWAAVSVDDLAAAADPFRPSGDLVWVLTDRARKLRRRRSAGAASGRPRVPALSA